MKKTKILILILLLLSLLTIGNVLAVDVDWTLEVEEANKHTFNAPAYPTWASFPSLQIDVSPEINLKHFWINNGICGSGNTYYPTRVSVRTYLQGQDLGDVLVDTKRAGTSGCNRLLAQNYIYPTSQTMDQMVIKEIYGNRLAINEVVMIHGKDVFSSTDSITGITSLGTVQELLNSVGITFEEKFTRCYTTYADGSGICASTLEEPLYTKVKENNPKVLFWFGGQTDYTKDKTDSAQDQVWACPDINENQMCDSLEIDACLASDGEWHDTKGCIHEDDCTSVGGVWVDIINKCCGDDVVNDTFPGCINGKRDTDKDGIIDEDDRCPNTPPTEIDLVYRDDPNHPLYGCGPSEGAACLIQGEGAVCQQGPLCVTNPAYNEQFNNSVCASITCSSAGTCDAPLDCMVCPIQNCNQYDSYFVGCYGDEYRDYIETYQRCNLGVCQQQECVYNVVDPAIIRDRDDDGVSDFCDDEPCGPNTFLGSRTSDLVGCFCEKDFMDCDKDLSNGCERNIKVEGPCPGIPTCTLPYTKDPLTGECRGPASGNGSGGIICQPGQYFCYGLCSDVPCDDLVGDCKDVNDYDCDGMSNDYEFHFGLLPFDPIDRDYDQDREGLINIREFRYWTDPFNSDTDGDGLTELEEVIGELKEYDGVIVESEYVTDPLNVDTDYDGLIDGDEVNSYQTNPTNSDIDEDGLLDGDEIQAIIDWVGITDEDLIRLFIQKDGCLIEDGCLGEEVGGMDGFNNGPYDQDSDGDGLTDFEEVKGVTLSNPFDPDNLCSFDCSEWSPDPCEEGETQTRTCSEGTNCGAITYTPSTSRICGAGFEGLAEKVPFFTPINIIITLLIIAGYYLVVSKKKSK